MKRLVTSLLIGMLPFVANGDEVINDREIRDIYLNGTQYTHFYLKGIDCPQAKNFFTLESSKADVERFYSLILAAYMANKKVNISYVPNGNRCDVTSISTNS